MPNELLKVTVANATEWRAWLAREAATSPGIWLTIAKKPTSSLTTLTYPEALDEALCQGWIDSTGYKIDDVTHTQRFTPRKPHSLWSKRNVGYIDRLEQEGRMQPAGRAAVEAAKADGRWDAAYSSASEPPPEFFAALAQVPEAQATWDILNKGNRWTIYFTLANLRTEAGREKRIKGFVEMLARGETPKPQKDKQKLDAKVSKVSNKATSRAQKQHVTPGAQSQLLQHRTKTTRSGRPAPSYNERD